MKLAKSLLLAVSFASAFIAFNVQAENLRCNGDLALIGDSKGSIFGKCGEPILKDSFCKPVEVCSGQVFLDTSISSFVGISIS